MNVFDYGMVVCYGLFFVLEYIAKNIVGVSDGCPVILVQFLYYFVYKIG